MRKKPKIKIEQKVYAVKAYLDGKQSMNQLSRDLNVSCTSVKRWVTTFESMGEVGLLPSQKNTNYSKELKYSAVNDYLSGQYSQLDICKKYKIRSTCQLNNWILKHNSHEEIKSYQTGGNRSMTKGRSTSFDERIEIVKYCIENNNDYNKSAEQYKVSYQQVRNTK